MHTFVKVENKINSLQNLKMKANLSAQICPSLEYIFDMRLEKQMLLCSHAVFVTAAGQLDG